MGLCDVIGPDAPAAPDYGKAAQQQGQANIDAARVGGKINNPNVINPYGKQTVSFESSDPLNAAQQRFKDMGITPTGGGNVSFGGKTYSADQYAAGNGVDLTELTKYANRVSDQPTITQTFSPEQQALFDQSNQTKLKLGGVAGQGADAVGRVIGKNVDLSGIPAAPKSGQVNQQVIDAMMGRVNEDYGKATDESNSSLIAAGIRPGSQAYADKMQLLQRGKNDASQQAVQAGYAQGQNQFNQQTQERKDAIAEYLTQRQVPLNEISALMSGSQVNNPFAVPGYAQNAQVGAAPVFGATQQKAAWDQGLYNVGAAQAGNTMSGLFGLGGALLGAGK